MFDMLASMDTVTGSTVADLFAGTGALGVEALSRGAAHAVFVDNDPAALDAIRVNLVSTGLYAWGVLEHSDVLDWLERAEPVDLTFVDPPYAFSDWPRVLERLRSGLAVLESDRELELPKRWEALRTKRYGGTVVTIVQSTEHVETQP